MAIAEFHQQMIQLTGNISDQAIDDALQTWLNSEYSAHSEPYAQLKESCLQGIEEGWLCTQEAGGIRYGRVFKPDDTLNRFSVDVVQMQDVVGPHHAHPTGEIDLIMPLDDTALFDGASAGWKVYLPGSAHKPTVSNGKALVLYLLPEGKIDFSR